MPQTLSTHPCERVVSQCFLPTACSRTHILLPCTHLPVFQTHMGSGQYTGSKAFVPSGGTGNTLRVASCSFKNQVVHMKARCMRPFSCHRAFCLRLLLPLSCTRIVCVWWVLARFPVPADQCVLMRSFAERSHVAIGILDATTDCSALHAYFFTIALRVTLMAHASSFSALGTSFLYSSRTLALALPVCCGLDNTPLPTGHSQ